jgi:hypothetical protein
MVIGIIGTLPNYTDRCLELDTNQGVLWVRRIASSTFHKQQADKISRSSYLGFGK